MPESVKGAIVLVVVVEGCAGLVMKDIGDSSELQISRAHKVVLAVLPPCMAKQF